MVWIPIAVVASFLVVRVFFGYPRRGISTQHLSDAEVALIRAAGEVFFPAGGAISPSFEQARVVEYIDEYMGWYPPLLRRLMKLLFFATEHGTILFVPSLKRFSQLDVEARQRYLASWETSNFYPRRLLFQSLRSIFCMAYIADDTVRREIGIGREGTCTSRLVNAS